jgi:ADP-heptose:LPS heptosyltransferase
MPTIQQKNRIIELTQSLNIKEFYESRNKVLIIRSCGGLGDILIHRMIFEDFKILNPEIEIHFACPIKYHEALIDHPFIDKILDSETINRKEYLIHYSTSTACGRYELGIAPLCGKHRSDIWANHCGVELTKHNMHINFSEEETREGKRIVESYRDTDGPSVAFCPISAMSNKNLSESVMRELLTVLKNMGMYVFGLHTTPIELLLKLNTPMINGLKIRQWMSVLKNCDYVITVDSAHFHCAGGMNKPTLGIFTFINSETYSKYYYCTETIQGPCPYGYMGCYNWTECPESKSVVPCCKNLSSEQIILAFKKMINNYPL